MDVSYVLTDEALVVAPVGRIDEASWEEFGSKLTSGLEQASAQSRGTLVIDLSGVDYMSSRGLRVLTVARQRGSRRLSTRVAGTGPARPPRCQKMCSKETTNHLRNTSW